MQDKPSPELAQKKVPVANKNGSDLSNITVKSKFIANANEIWPNNSLLGHPSNQSDWNSIVANVTEILAINDSSSLSEDKVKFKTVDDFMIDYYNNSTET